MTAKKTECKVWAVLEVTVSADGASAVALYGRYDTRKDAADAVWGRLDGLRRKLFEGDMDAYAADATIEDFRITWNTYALLAEGDSPERRWRIVDIDLCSPF